MTKTISQRIALAGSEEIRKQLGLLGEWGEKAFREIQAAAEKLRGPGAAFARNMDAARKRVRELGTEFDRVGTKIRNFGAAVSVGLTAPLVLAAKQSVTAWNEQVDAIQKVAPRSPRPAASRDRPPRACRRWRATCRASRPSATRPFSPCKRCC